MIWSEVKCESSKAFYDEMLSYAQKKGYSSFTKLQKKTFCQTAVYNDSNDLFICGNTSSGKTLIPLLLYSRKLHQSNLCDHDVKIPNMLFIVPYRALANQKYFEFCDFFVSDNLTIVQSTGEFCQYDNLIQSGDVNIAIIITEKVYKFSARNDAFLSKYDYIVLDEVGLIDDPDRGIRLDFILAWAKRQCEMTGRPRIIALGTPFYNWSAYIHSFNLYPITDVDRPIELKDFPIFYNPNFGIDKVTSNNPCLHRVRLLTKKQYNRAAELYGVPAYKCSACQEMCPVDTECRHDSSKNCPLIKRQCVDPIEYLTDEVTTVCGYILGKICRYHIRHNHQILIFLNDRERVKQLCRQLFFQLEDLLQVTSDTESFRNEFLKEINLDEEDVYGILEEGNGEKKDMTFYRILSAGIGFHSRALPYELRAYVEKKLLESRELKIVCSTETLAYGVNSNVDVVIIPELQKNDGVKNRLLTFNEYRNYAGRAGRLSQDRFKQTENHGYVYTLIRNSQCSFWEQMNLGKEKSTPLYSKMFDVNNQDIAFVMLNLFPYDSTPISLENVSQLIQVLPRPDNANISLWKNEITHAINFLTCERLIVSCQHNSLAFPTKNVIVEYALTKRGQALRGFLITETDYILIRDTTRKCIGGIVKDIEYDSFLYYLLTSKHIESELNGIFYNSETRLSWDEIKFFYSKRYNGKKQPEWLENAQPNNRVIYILTALLCWMSGGSNKVLYNQFGIYYALLNKLAGQLAYLVEIACAMLPAMLDDILQENGESMEIGIDDFYEALNKKNHQIHKFFCTVLYGIDIGVWNEIINFLRKHSDVEYASMLNKFSENNIEPKSAHLLRQIAVRYHFFLQPSLENDKNIEVRNNYCSQKAQYYNDIKSMGEPIIKFFEQTFNIKIC